MSVVELTASSFDYKLPAERIAQLPLEQRDASRLLLVARDGSLHDRRFIELPELLRPGDVLVANDSRVRRARLRGRLDERRAVEILVIERRDDNHLCLVRPARHARSGMNLQFEGGLQAVVVGIADDHPGARLLRFFSGSGDQVEHQIQAIGAAPLPPYIHHPLDEPGRYSTVYEQGEAASAAAPTAGLHFTERVLSALRARGIEWCALQLHVGLATFAPLRVEHLEDHRMHEEAFALPSDSATTINAARAHGGRVVAVGTTVMRALESCATPDGMVHATEARTGLFIRPGHRFHAVDGLLTNFHQPRSSLLVLLAAFIGMDAWRAAYEHALGGGYRFLSFGDCMLAWRKPT